MAQRVLVADDTRTFRALLRSLLEQAPDVLVVGIDRRSTQALGLPEEIRAAYLLANPLGMSADGLQRYWRKFRAA